MIIGNVILAFLVSAFILPHDIIMGGATGIGIIMSMFLPMDTASIVLIFNIMMLILGGIVLGKKFLLTTVTSSLLYPVFLLLMQQIPDIGSITDNTLVASLFAGGLLGIALGLLMGNGSSSGGTDVLNLVLNKWFHIPVAVAVYLVDIIIMAGQLLCSDLGIDIVLLQQVYDFWRYIQSIDIIGRTSDGLQQDQRAATNDDHSESAVIIIKQIRILIQPNQPFQQIFFKKTITRTFKSQFI